MQQTSIHHIPPSWPGRPAGSIDQCRSCKPSGRTLGIEANLTQNPHSIGSSEEDTGSQSFLASYTNKFLCFGGVALGEGVFRLDIFHMQLSLVGFYSLSDPGFNQLLLSFSPWKKLELTDLRIFEFELAWFNLI